MKAAAITFTYLAMAATTLAADGVVWQQEFTCDQNSRCKVGAMLVNQENGEVTVLGTSERAGQGRAEVDYWLWRVGPNGGGGRKTLLGPASFEVPALGLEAAIERDTGRIAWLSRGDRQQALLNVIGRDLQPRTFPIAPEEKWSKGVLFRDMALCRDGTMLAVGRDSDSSGLIVKADLSGNVTWKEVYKRDQVTILSSVACIPDGDGFYVAGLSAEMASAMAFAKPPTVWLLRYDGNGKLKASDSFEGGMGLLAAPTAICLSSGTVAVAYDKSENPMVEDKHVRAYTPQLECMYDKVLFRTDEEESLGYFGLCSISENQFVAASGIISAGLRLYECSADGTIEKTLQVTDKLGAGGLCVGYLEGKILMAFAAGANDGSSKAPIKLLALRP
ncbi:MAG: hypothetical protein JW993_02035 [Sedimentisphaerales bacterium]|nr:hypothetical protein [Sedimentisphaerales bacterium]